MKLDDATLARLRGPVVLSLLAAMLAAVTSLAGILFRGTYVRETSAWAVQAVGQDCANLLVLVLLIGSATLARNGSARGMLVWLGCLLYLIYAFAIYAFAVHFNPLFLAYVAVLGLSFYAVVGGFSAVNVAEVVAPLRDNPHRTGASTLLTVIGVMFAGLWLADIVPHALGNTTPPSLTDTALWTNPVHVLDLAFFLPAMVVTGVLLRKQHDWGLFLSVPLLVFAVTMGVAILFLFGLSAIQGLPVALPAVIGVGAIVVVSGLYVGLLLRSRALAG